jgi:hypothetical protein
MATQGRWTDIGGTTLKEEFTLPVSLPTLDFSKKLGPETEKVFGRFEDAGIRVDYMGYSVKNNHTLIDAAPLSLTKKENETFQKILVWKIITIARSRWTIKDGKALIENNVIAITDVNIHEVVKFCRDGGWKLKIAIGYAKSMEKGRWLNLETFSQALKWVFGRPLQYVHEPTRKDMDLDLDRAAAAAWKKGTQHQLMVRLLEDIFCIVNKGDRLSPHESLGVVLEAEHIQINDSFTRLVYDRLLNESNMNHPPPSTTNGLGIWNAADLTRLNLSKKLGPETDKVFKVIRKCGIDVNYVGRPKYLRSNHTEIDHQARVLTKDKNASFHKLLIWRALEIFHSRWSVTNGKAVYPNNDIDMIDPEIKQIATFVREEFTMDSEMKLCLGYSESIENGRWLNLPVFAMAVQAVFNRRLDFRSRSGKEYVHIDSVAIAAHKKGIQQELMAKLLEEIYKIVNTDQQQIESLPSKPRELRDVVMRSTSLKIRDIFTRRVYNRLLDELDMNDPPAVRSQRKHSADIHPFHRALEILLGRPHTSVSPAILDPPPSSTNVVESSDATL